MNWTEEDLKAALKNNPTLAKKNTHILDHIPEVGKKVNKFNAKVTYIDGIKFHSQAEADRYCELKVLQMAGVVKAIEIQPGFDIGAGMRYTADFKVTYSDGHEEIEEVKGFETKDYRMRIKLFKEKYPNLILKVIKNGISLDK